MRTAKTLIRLGGCHFVGFVMRRLNYLFLCTLLLSRVDLSEVEFGKYVEDDLHFSKVTPAIQITESSTRETDNLQKGKQAKYTNSLGKG